MHSGSVSAPEIQCSVNTVLAGRTPGPPFQAEAASSHTQTEELLAIGRGQPVAARTLIQICLFQPISYALPRGLELEGHFLRAGTGSREFDNLLPYSDGYAA